MQTDYMQAQKEPRAITALATMEAAQAMPRHPKGR